MNENTSTNTSNTAPKVFEIIDGNTLMAQEYEPLQFAVEKILPHGVFILAGSGKIGKSWLSLDLCVNVASPLCVGVRILNAEIPILDTRC